MSQLSDFLGSVSQDLFALGIALALGALIGLQRGWHARDKAAGQRVAGIRTHALLGLLGGLSVQLGREFIENVSQYFQLTISGKPVNDH